MDAKRATEMEAEKGVKAKAAEEMSNWMTQRDIRLRAKKVRNAVLWFGLHLYRSTAMGTADDDFSRFFLLHRMETGAKNRYSSRRSSQR